MLNFELLSRDAAGRIFKIKEGDKKIRTPTIAIVVNPNKMTLSIKELKKAGVDLIITNAYILMKSKYREEIEKKGLHRFFKWKNFIYTDSGTYQMFSRDIKEIDNALIVKFQKKIKSDFVTPVDVFTLPTDDYKTSEKKLGETFKRVEKAREIVGEIVFPIQGGMHLSLRKKACLVANSYEPKIFAIGGIVPLMNEYRYKELLDIILTCKVNLKPNIPVHAFGAGHPMTFALLTACGVDIFDSAMYSLAAYEERYLTPYGTKRLDKLIEFPCSCEVCSKHSPKDLKEMDKKEREKLLAKHNLHAIIEEIKRVRQAIVENALWELVQIRARSHVNILKALLFALKKYKKYFVENDVFPKPRGINYSGKETEMRPEIVKSKQKLKNVKSKSFVEIKPFGKVPKNLLSTYPFLHFQGMQEFEEREVNWKSYFKLLLEYQFGKNASKAVKNFELEIAKTGKPRYVFSNGERIGTISAETGFFLPNLRGVQLLKNFMKKVYVKKEAERFVRKSKYALAKFLYTKDKITPGEEVIIISEDGKLIGCGKSILNAKEINSFQRGNAIKVRDSIY